MADMTVITVKRGLPAPAEPEAADDVVSSTGVGAEVSGPLFTGELWVRLDYLTNGQVVIRHMRITTEEPITEATLRAIDLRWVLEHVLSPTDQAEAEQQARALLSRLGFTEREIELLRWPPAQGEPRVVGHEGPSWEDLERFAAEYRFAERIQPSRAISRTIRQLEIKGLRISRSTANRWREMCQRTDPPLLPPSSKPTRTPPVREAQTDE